MYADSLTAVSADGFLFSKHYPYAVDDFERSFKFLQNTPCDILLTPHPDFSNLWQRLERRQSDPDALVDTAACHRLADSSRKEFKARLASEARP